MQSVNFHVSSAFLMVLTLIALTACDVTPTTTAAITSPPKVKKPEPQTHSEPAAQNNGPQVEPLNVEPTRPTDTSSAKPPIKHELTTMKPTMPTEQMNNTGTVGTNAAKTDKKNGASRGGPEFLVTGLIVVILSAVYA